MLQALRLIRSPGIGPLVYRNLIKEHGSEEEALSFLRYKKKNIFSEKEALSEIKRHEEKSIYLLPYWDERYPKALKNMTEYPPLLSVLGKVEALHQPMIAMVGSRNASVHGTRLTLDIAKKLADCGYAIVSGLARGIDSAAHKGALEQQTNPLPTIAVMAGGVDQLYPPEHGPLRDAIMNRGCLISEMPLGMFPGASHFPRRNRLISGLSLAVCVMEAAKPSGSLITANYALEQGKELFAVPGFPLDARSKGTNDLIRNGAYVLESEEDILSVLGAPCPKLVDRILVDKEKTQGPMKKSLNTCEKNPPEEEKICLELKEKILENLSTVPLSTDDLLIALEGYSGDIHSALLALEFEGSIHRDARGYFSKLYTKE